MENKWSNKKAERLNLVGFEVAKILKELSYHRPGLWHYSILNEGGIETLGIEPSTDFCTGTGDAPMYVDTLRLQKDWNDQGRLDWFTAPTIQEAYKWLLEMWEISIGITIDTKTGNWIWTIQEFEKTKRGQVLKTNTSWQFMINGLWTVWDEALKEALGIVIDRKQRSKFKGK